MNLKQMEAFYWLTKFKSYQRVADHIGLTQPAVSARIFGLEDSLGVQLLDRMAPEFTLTEKGYEVAEYAESFLNLTEALTSRLKIKQQRRYVIGVVGMVTRTWAQTLRRKVLDDPEIGLVDFQSGSNLELRQQVRTGALDMAFVTGEAGLPQISDSFSTLYKVGWVARPDVVGPIKRALTPDELRGLPLILYPHTSPLSRPVADMVDEIHRRPNSRHSGNSLSTICDMVRSGFGASALPLAAMEREIASGMVVEIPTTVQLAPLDIRCVYVNRSRKQHTQKILALARQAAEEWAAAHPRYVSFSAN